MCKPAFERYNTTTFRFGHVIPFPTQAMGGMRNLDVCMRRVGDMSGVENGVVPENRSSCRSVPRSISGVNSHRTKSSSWPHGNPDTLNREYHSTSTKFCGESMKPPRDSRCGAQQSTVGIRSYSNSQFSLHMQYFSLG